MGEKDLNKEISRRDIMRGVGLFAAGVAVSQLGGMISKADASYEAANKWQYKKIDPVKAAETAYNAWFEVFCAQATATGIFEQLKEKVGGPWKTFPIDSLKFGMGGMLGWGLTCGSPVSASLIIGLTAPSELVNPMIHDLLQWYSETAMPVYVPKEPRANKEKIIQTVSSSPLCHLSLGKWMKAANSPFGSNERKDRCARLTASVTYRTVEMLNAWKDGKYVKKDAWNAPASVGLPAQQNCNECHGSNIPTAPRAK